MKQRDIPRFEVDASLPAAARSLRRSAPKYLAQTLESMANKDVMISLEQLLPEQLEILGGGVDAATYLIHSPDSRVIVKFGWDGVAAEVEALRAWRDRSARVPKVLAAGTVPGTSTDPVKFMIQEALITHQGRVVELCTDYLAHYPNQSRAIGRQMGRQLSKMHQATSTRSFGEFADTVGSASSYGSWARYVEDYWQVQEEYVGSVGISADDFVRVKHFIASQHYSRRGHYLHGDFSIRNAAVKQYEPLKVSIFDPNPLIGDPSWDIAPLMNNYEFQKRRLKYSDSQRALHDRDKQLVIGFRQGYTRRIYAERLQVAQLLHAVLQARFKQDVLQNDEDTLDLKVRIECIKEWIAEIVQKEGS